MTLHQLFFTSFLVKSKYAFKVAHIYEAICYYASSELAMNKRLINEFSRFADSLFLRLQAVDRGIEADVDYDYAHKQLEFMLSLYNETDEIDVNLSHLSDYLKRETNRMLIMLEDLKPNS